MLIRWLNRVLTFPMDIRTALPNRVRLSRVYQDLAARTTGLKQVDS